MNRYFKGLIRGRAYQGRTYQDVMIERFWLYVNKEPGQGPQGKCWEWTGSRYPAGYGMLMVKLSNGDFRPIRASVLSFEIHYGDLCDLQTLHNCDNPPCVRPIHLWSGTQSDNIRDAISKGRLIPVSQRYNRSDYTETTEGFRREMRGARIAAGLSLNDIALRTGISPSYVSMIERMPHTVKRDVLSIIRTTLGIAANL